MLCFFQHIQEPIMKTNRLFLFFFIVGMFFIFCHKSPKTEPEIPYSDIANDRYLFYSGQISEPSYLQPSNLEEGELPIIFYGPVGRTDGRAQIRVEFAEPLIPLSAINDTTRQNRLGHFRLEPSVQGNFRFVSPSIVVFEPEHRLPRATLFRVTLTAGLKDLKGHRLSKDFSWEFQTPPIRLNLHPPQDATHVRVDVTPRIASNVALNIESLRSHIQFYETTSGAKIPFELKPWKKNPDPALDVGREKPVYYYFLETSGLKKNTQYTVNVAPGVLPLQGNLPTKEAFSTTFRTYEPFRFVKLDFCEECGTHLVTWPFLQFTNDVDFSSASENIIIEPTVNQSVLGRYSCVRYSISLMDQFLKPHTTYTVTLKKGLKDEFGQTLENPQKFTFTTGELTPELLGPDGFQIITPRVQPRIQIKTANISTLKYRLIPISAQDLFIKHHLQYGWGIDDFLDVLQSPVQELDIPLDSSGYGFKEFDLSSFLRGGKFGAVVYSFQSPRVNCYPDPLNLDGVLIRTDIGLHMQIYPTEGLIKLNRLSDGSPIAHAKIQIYRSEEFPSLEKLKKEGVKPSSYPFKPCLVRETDENGLVVLSIQDVQRCLLKKEKIRRPALLGENLLEFQKQLGFPQRPSLFVVVEKDSDWTFLKAIPWGNPSTWEFGVREAWETEKPEARGTLFTEHYLYHPGDTVHVKAVIRYLQFGKLHLPKNIRFRIELIDPMGNRKSLGKVTCNEFGTLHFPVPTRKDQPLGVYRITLTHPKSKLRYTGSFKLAEFRTPEFFVTMSASPEIAVINQPVTVRWEGKYYFGAPMANVRSNLRVTRWEVDFHPSGWDEFQFSIPHDLREKPVSLSGVYTQETIRLDQSGSATREYSFKPVDAPFPMAYLFDVEVEDVSHQTSSANKQITVLPDKQMVGLKLSDWIVSSKKPFQAQVVVVSPEGQPIPDVPLRVKLIRREYHTVQVEAPDGKHMEENLVQKEVAVQEVTSQKEPVTVNFIPPKAGTYMVLAELKKSPHPGNSAAQALWVSGQDYVPWKEPGEDRLEIIMNKKVYQVGDTAVALIQSPFPEAELLVTISREKIYHREVLHIRGSAYSYKFVVTREMLPNAFVGGVLLRLGKPLVPVQEEEGKHLERIGFVPFYVSLQEKYLTVDVKPSMPKLPPGKKLTVQLHAKRSDGAGQPCEFTVMVVDEAVLSLSNYQLPDLVNTMYREGGLSVQVNDNRPFVVNERALLQKGGGYGGGLLSALGGLQVRKRFRKVAYYNPHLLSDAQGNASFSVNMPDNLTSWRILVVAVDRENRFGNGSASVTVTQPFILRAVQPRFARLDDRFQVGVAINNLTESDGQVEILAELPGNMLTPEESAPLQKTVQLKAGETRAVLFPVRASRTGKATLRYRARLTGTYNGKTFQETDALESHLNVEQALMTESVVTTGEVEKDFTQKLTIAPDVRPDVGGLELLLASTALINLSEGTRYLIDYPYGCLEQTVSRLKALMELKYLAKKYHFTLPTEKPLEQVIQENLNKVFQLRNYDGGFKYWANDENSDPFISPEVAHLFRRARQLGYIIPTDIEQGLRQYLSEILRQPPDSHWNAEEKTEFRIIVLGALRALGENDESFFEEFFNRRNKLSILARIQLAELMYASPNWHQEAQVLLRNISNNLFISARSAHLESPAAFPPAWNYLNSTLITTARALKLYLNMEPDNHLIPRLARYILDARHNGHWRNTYENATAIDALTEYSLKKESQSPHFKAEVRLAGQKILEHLFSEQDFRPIHHFIPMNQLPTGHNEITLHKSGNGTLYFTLSYAYRLKGLQPARWEGFRVKRKVLNHTTGDLLGEFSETAPKQITVKAGEVLRIELEVNVLQDGYHLVVDDPLPAGLEAINMSLKNVSERYRDSDLVINPLPVVHQELHGNRATFFCYYAKAGIYRHVYLVRATTSGTFHWPGAHVSLMYEPEQFGRCAEGTIEVQ